ncbi:unnamed protein product [Peniophora sp. CBMAI 1063]|nr:unnamed protein product [Peniophora sp. CBMAI 1063]
MVANSLRAQLLQDIETSPKLYLMKSRPEPQRNGPPKTSLMKFRHYLHLRDKEERKAFVRVLASEHPFALEKLRHGHTRNYKIYSVVPRDRRLCRLCADAIESPEHALLLCTGDDRLRDMRAIFLAQAAARQPGLPDTRDAARATETLQSLLSLPNIAGELARYILFVFDLFDSVALVWPPDLITRIPRTATAGQDRGRGRGRGRRLVANT